MDPESNLRDLTNEQRGDLYAEAWAYYRNRVFSKRNGEEWTIYIAQRGLYKHTRLIYNPVPSIVDFYVDNIWQPANNDDYEALVTPLSRKTDEKLIEAVAQLDQWGNFLSESQKMKRYASACGNVLIEGVDDLERGKILHRTVWPGYVTQLELNATGDVQSYTLQYKVYDPAAQQDYQYRKVVTKDDFSYFRDDKAFVPPGKSAAVEANPYGFCFAVWIRHADDGGDFGLPACAHLDKVDEVNSLASHLHDHIHKSIESPKVISTDSEILPLIGAQQTGPEGRRTLTPQDPRLNWVVFKTGTGATVHDLAGDLSLAESDPHLNRLLTSFTDDYPELQAATMIRENSQLSGAALERMLTPAQNRLDSFQAGYNEQLIKLRQMQIAVGGMRASGGGWTSMTKQQKLFAQFGLSSYERGDLDISLRQSLLVGETEDEREDLLIKKASRATVMSELVDQQEALSIAGYGDEEIKEIMQRQAKENELITDPPENDDPPADDPDDPEQVTEEE